MNYYIVGERDGQQVCWSKKSKSFVPRDERAYDAWELVWGTRSAAVSYARRHGLPTACVHSTSWTSTPIDVSAVRRG